MRNLLGKCVTAGVALVAASAAAPAAIVYEQNFETLNAGGLTNQTAVTLNGQDGYTATTGAVVKVVNTGGVSYSGGSVNVPGGDNAVRLDTWNSGEAGFSRSFASQTADIYFSYTYSIVNFSSDDFHWFTFGNIGTVGTAGTVGSSLGIASRSDTNQPPGLYVRSRNGTTNTNGPAYNLSANSFTDASGTFFLVGKISKTLSSPTYNTIDMWVNPTSSTEVAPTRSVTANTGLASISAFRVLLGNSSNQLDAGDSITYDNLRIATSFSEVVPEPASLGLLCLATMALSRRRRV